MNALSQILDAIRRVFTWWVTVAPWEAGLRVRFGKRVKLLHAGIYLRIPFADRIYLQSTRLRVANLSPQTLSTRDGKVITLVANLAYTIEDIERLYETLHHAQDSLEYLVAARIARYVTSHDANECLPWQIVAGAQEDLDLKCYGIGECWIALSDIAFVRTYRIITGDGYRGRFGDHLDTSRHLDVKLE